jgi:hypothetical protein
MKNQIVSDILRKSDIMFALSNIEQQAQAERDVLKNPIKINIDGDGEDKQEEQPTPDPVENKTQSIKGGTFAERPDSQPSQNLADNKDTLIKNPAQLSIHYNTFQKRIKHNLHIIFQYSPSGINFRKKLIENKQLLMSS